MIVQELHKIQHEFGYLPREQLFALHERLNAGKTDRRDEIKLYQLHQVASFFPHFRLEPPPAADVRVCRDMACFMNGGPECRATPRSARGRNRRKASRGRRRFVPRTMRSAAGRRDQRSSLSRQDDRRTAAARANGGRWRSPAAAIGRSLGRSVGRSILTTAGQPTPASSGMSKIGRPTNRSNHGCHGHCPEWPCRLQDMPTQGRGHGTPSIAPSTDHDGNPTRQQGVHLQRCAHRRPADHVSPS